MCFSENCHLLSALVPRRDPYAYYLRYHVQGALSYVKVFFIRSEKADTSFKLAGSHQNLAHCISFFTNNLQISIFVYLLQLFSDLVLQPLILLLPHAIRSSSVGVVGYCITLPGCTFLMAQQFLLVYCAISTELSAIK